MALWYSISTLLPPLLLSPPLPSLPSLPSLSSFLCSNATTTYNTPPPLIYSCFRAQTGSSLQPALLQSREGGGGRGGGGDTSRMLSLRQIQLINSHTVSTSSFLSPAHEKTPKKKTFFSLILPPVCQNLHSPSSFALLTTGSPTGPRPPLPQKL